MDSDAITTYVSLIPPKTITMYRLLILGLVAHLVLSKQQGMILYRYTGALSPKVIISGNVINIQQNISPHYGLETFDVDGTFTFSLQDFEDTLQSFSMPGGWIWSTDSVQVDGSDFFYFINGNLRFISRDDYTKLYDQVGRPQFHFSAPIYWINDPNGMVHSGGKYHLSYQYDPFNLMDSGVLFWGHAVSSDMIHWKHQPAQLFPNKTKLTTEFTGGGIFSGGSLEHEGKIYNFYTDHFQSSSQFIESQYVEVDGQATLIIDSTQKPEGASNDFRDPAPYVNRQTGKLNLVLGTAINGIPSVVQYSSTDILSGWTFDAIIYSGPTLPSTTIECPNKVYLSDMSVLLFSINDVIADSSYGLYVVGFDDENGVFHNTTDIRRTDFGGHYYATQVFTETNSSYEQAKAITWMQNWNQPKQYLGNKYFSGVMSLPRVLTLKQGYLMQNPVVDTLRTALLVEATSTHFNYLIPEMSDILISQPGNERFNAKLSFKDSTTQSITVEYTNPKFTLTVIETNNTLSYESDTFPISDTSNVRIIVDRGALEVFGNSGYVTFSQRFLQESFKEYIQLQVESVQPVDVQVFSMGTFY